MSVSCRSSQGGAWPLLGHQLNTRQNWHHLRVLLSLRGQRPKKVLPIHHQYQVVLGATNSGSLHRSFSKRLYQIHLHLSPNLPALPPGSQCSSPSPPADDAAGVLGCGLPPLTSASCASRALMRLSRDLAFLLFFVVVAADALQPAGWRPPPFAARVWSRQHTTLADDHSPSARLGPPRLCLHRVVGSHARQSSPSETAPTLIQ
mmetsp:Transcript_70815/g.147565  ORF Transcript_70815/g.147565 Transcript_70815/m.147565 type:complete len:204 (+) Transcript_70815:428-1039(+)